ncbi:MAG: T9SS type A sorting domain-containing protein [Crocinitomicaceae bacterium]|nr:T9SS type A sorting domain-containing protein [Crocinitomicaceae bacterium]
MKKIYKTFFGLLFCSASIAQTTSVPFTNNGTFLVPAGVTEIDIEVVGAGGDGGGNGGGGGGGGGYASGTYTVTPGATLNITVGTNGSGSIAGTTSVDALILATGGSNGNSGGASPGGAPGNGVGGTINRSGGAGGNGTYTYFGGGGGGAGGSVSNGTIGGSTPAWTGSNCLQPGGSAGNSGGAPGGNGGKGSGFIDGSCTGNNPATPGLNYGGGGGGGNGNSGPSSPGADGYCVITYTSCTLDLTTSVTGSTITSNEAGATYSWIDCSTGSHIPGETNSSYTATVSGSYSVIVDNGTCADTTDCVDVCVLDLTTTVNGLTITANAVGATSYSWIDCSDGSHIIGENSSSYTATADGEYSVIVQVGTCMDTTDCVTISGVGINENQTNLNLTVYPNPFKNKLVIENENGSEYFELINAQGQLVYSGKNIESADFSNLPEGVYVLRISRDELKQIISMIKM